MSAHRLSRIAIRVAVTAFQAVRRGIWAVTRPQVEGVHGVALTPDGRIVLVRLTYASGWHLPGGGRKKNEPKLEAVLRELREEIGLVSHGRAEFCYAFRHRADNREATNSVYLLPDVVYRARKSLEVEEVGAFPPDALPPETTDLTRETILRVLRRPDRGSRTEHREVS